MKKVIINIIDLATGLQRTIIKDCTLEEGNAEETIYAELEDYNCQEDTIVTKFFAGKNNELETVTHYTQSISILINVHIVKIN